MRHLLRAVCLIAVAALGCGGTPEATPAAPSSSDAMAADDTSGALRINPQAFNPHSHPFGTPMSRWAEKLWSWIFSVPTDQNPFLDTTGVDCAVNQPDGPVWYLAPAPGGAPSLTRSCTIPQGRAVLILLSGTFNDFPCPDPTFAPADGQSLYEFLLAGAHSGPDAVNFQNLTVDGNKLQRIFDYHETSPDVFSFTGDISLQTSLDGCVTGSSQSAVTDNFVIMLRPLSSGPHTVVYHVKDVHGTDLTVSYLLTVQ
jgi:hypothetical protein